MKKFSFIDLFKKHYVLKETFVATVFTVTLTFLVSFIPFKFEFSKAIRQEFLGFDIYDLYYSGKHLKDFKKDSNIVIVEIAKGRNAIAEQISRIQKYSPKVIGIDAVFEKEEDPLGSLKLYDTLRKFNNIIVGCRFIDTTVANASFTFNFFDTKEQKYPAGYINFIGTKYSVIRNYPPFLKIGNSDHSAFTSAIAEKFSPERFKRLKKRDRSMEVINYTGNLESYVNLSAEQLRYSDSTDQLGNILIGKIVLLGYFVKESPETPLIMEDIYFSPVNERIAGKSYPDMYGVVMHANILSMVLDEKGNYITLAPEWTAYLCAAAIIFFFLFYMLSQYRKKEHPKHGKFLLIQFLLILFMLYLFLRVFEWFHTKIPLLPIMISLVLCVELLGLYKIIALWMHKKIKYRTVFSHKHTI